MKLVSIIGFIFLTAYFAKIDQPEFSAASFFTTAVLVIYYMMQYLHVSVPKF
jgi:hypothetical protein